MKKKMSRNITALTSATALVIGGGAVAFADDPEPEDAPGIVNVADGDHSDYAPEIEVSFVPDWNDENALNDGITDDVDGHGEVWATYGEFDESHTAEYSWPVPVTISGSNVWFWNDEPDPANVRPPEGWSLEYLDEETGDYESIDAEYPVEGDSGAVRGPNEVEFDEITTSKLRMTVEAEPFEEGDDNDEVGDYFAIGVAEWEVMGYYEAEEEEEPAPENPDDPLEWEEVTRRTVAGEAPSLPEKVWGIPEDGPLGYYDVDWDTSDASWDEDTTVTGSIAEPEATVSADVYVVDNLDADIEYLEYAATITTPGNAPVCPTTVTAAYDDGSSASDIDVQWADVDESEYAEAEMFGDITGTVDETDEEAVCTFFVVDPEEGDDLPPAVNIELDSSPESTGWYLSHPSFTLDADALSGELETVEYSLDEGETWVEYSEETEVDEEGEVEIQARATDDEGREGTAETSLQIDTRPPETSVDYEVDAEAGSARFTLDTVDPEPGSGLRRVLFSYGTSDDPENLGENEMWATYEDPFSISLREEDPVYVHVHSQDYAGHQEETQTFELDPLDETDPGDGDDEDGSDEDGSDEDGSDEDGSGEDGDDQDGSDEGGSDEDGTEEDGSDQDGSADAGSDEDGDDQDGTSDDGSADDGSGTDSDDGSDQGSAGDGADDDASGTKPPNQLPVTGATIGTALVVAVLLIGGGFAVRRFIRSA